MIGHSFIFSKASAGAVRFRGSRHQPRTSVNPYRPAELDLPARSKPRIYLAYDQRHDGSAADRLVDSCADRCQFVEDRGLRLTDLTLGPSSQRLIDESDATVVVIGNTTHELSVIDQVVCRTLEAHHGLVAISVPRLNDVRTHLPDRIADNVRSGFARWYTFPKYPGDLWQMIQEALDADRSLVRNDRPPMAGQRADSTSG